MEQLSIFENGIYNKETNTFINPEKQIKHEEREKEWDLEM